MWKGDRLQILLRFLCGTLLLRNDNMDIVIIPIIQTARFAVIQYSTCNMNS